MNFNQKVTNPMLVGAIELLKAEDSPEHRMMLEEEMIKAMYLSPVMIDPRPEKKESGELIIKQGSKLQFPTLTAPNGDKFFMAFTDRLELEKSGKKEEFEEAVLNFADYIGMLFGKNTTLPDGGGVVGFVINPFGGNIIMPKEAAMAVFMKHMPKNKR